MSEALCNIIILQMINPVPVHTHSKCILKKEEGNVNSQIASHKQVDTDHINVPNKVLILALSTCSDLSIFKCFHVKALFSALYSWLQPQPRSGMVQVILYMLG